MLNTMREKDLGTVLKNKDFYYTIKKENGRIGLNMQINDINKIGPDKFFEAITTNFKLFLPE